MLADGSSTLDLFGSRFVVLRAAGDGVDEWAPPGAASHVIDAEPFAEAYGLSPGGATLVRPDGVVAWRSRGPADRAEIAGARRDGARARVERGAGGDRRRSDHEPPDVGTGLSESIAVAGRLRRFDAETRSAEASLRRIFDEARDYASNPCVLFQPPRPGRAASSGMSTLALGLPQPVTGSQPVAAR